MIYFIEHDTAGNIVHVCADPQATIVPLINRVTFNDMNGNPLKDANGNELSPHGAALCEPLGISQEMFDRIMADGAAAYTCDPASLLIYKRAA